MFDDGFTALLPPRASPASASGRCGSSIPPARSTIDFLAHTFRNTTPFGLNARFAASEAGRDRLGVSLGDFLAAVRGERAGPLADGADGVRALDLALAVEQAIGG